MRKTTCPVCGLHCVEKLDGSLLEGEWGARMIHVCRVKALRERA